MIAIVGNIIGRAPGNGGNGEGYAEDGSCYTLTATDRHAVAYGRQGRIARAFAQNTRDEVRFIGGDGSIAGALCAQPGGKQQTYVMASGASHAEVEEDISPTLTAHNSKEAPILCSGGRKVLASNGDDLVGCLAARDYKGVGSQYVSDGKVILEYPEEGLDDGDWTLRRLTPLECERLQGFPDGWTDVPFRPRPIWVECEEGEEGADLHHFDEDTGEPVWMRLEQLGTSDAHRYKALGNSMAVPVMAWIGERLQAVQDYLDEAGAHNAH